MSGFMRGGPRGGSAKRGGRGSGIIERRGGRFGRSGHDGHFDDSQSPDRRSASSDHDFAPRFSNYREPSRQHSRSPERRSPSPPSRNLPRNAIDVRPSRQMRSDRRSPSPPNRGGKHIDGRSIRQTDERHRTEQSSSASHRQEEMSEIEFSRDFAIKLSDADEAVRRAEYELRRAQMLRKNLCDSHEDFLNHCIQREKAKQRQAW